MHALATPMATTSSSITVRVLAADTDGRRPQGVMLDVGGRTRPVSAWRSMGPADDPVWHAVEVIEELQPAKRHAITLSQAGSTLDRAQASTLPVTADRFGIVVGSCFDVDQGKERIRRLYGELSAFGEDTPHVNLWLGDQVYVDAPALGGVWPRNPTKVILGKYRKTWGLGAGGRNASGLAFAMAGGANHFLPDDHEFWNNYPHGSFTLFGHTALRLTKQTARYLIGRTRWVEAKLPHPHSQGPWGRAAGAAYCVFQTDRDVRRFSEDDSPEPVQRIDVGSMVILLVDTRWHRTVRKGSSGIFMPDPKLKELVDELTTEDRLVCIGLSRPIIGKLPHRGPVRDKVDYAPEDFPVQYRRLWAALNHRADKGWPTMVLGGDVHNASLRLAQNDALLEVTSSPMGLLESLDEGPVVVARSGWKGVKKLAKRAFDWRAGRARPVADAYPVIGSDGVEWAAQPGRTVASIDDPSSVLTAITFELDDPAAPRVVIEAAGYDTKGRRSSMSSRLTWDGAWR